MMQRLILLASALLASVVYTDVDARGHGMAGTRLKPFAQHMVTRSGPAMWRELVRIGRDQMFAERVALHRGAGLTAATVRTRMERGTYRTCQYRGQIITDGIHPVTHEVRVFSRYTTPGEQFICDDSGTLWGSTMCANPVKDWDHTQKITVGELVTTPQFESWSVCTEGACMEFEDTHTQFFYPLQWQWQQRGTQK